MNLNKKNSNNSNQAQKISIPINPNTLRDSNNHINVDIYLRMDEYMPKNNQNLDLSNRSLDDFDHFNNPLVKHIRYYETNISRSLPGSSGSLNRNNPLPPLENNQNQFNKSNSNVENRNRNKMTQSEEGKLTVFNFLSAFFILI
jgi:hypothetical protein